MRGGDVGYKEASFFGKTYRAYQQEGNFTCGAACARNAIYRLTGTDCAERDIWHRATSRPYVSTHTAKSVGQLQWVEHQKGKETFETINPLFDSDTRESHFQKTEALRNKLGVPENWPGKAYLRPLTEKEEDAHDGRLSLEEEIDMSDVRKALSSLKFQCGTELELSPKDVLEKLKSNDWKTSVYVAGAKWTANVDDEGGGHWVCIADMHSEGEKIVFIVLDSLSGVEAVRSCPVYQQTDGENGFLDGWLMPVSAPQ